MPQHAVPSILVKGDNLQATPIHFEHHLPAAGGQRRAVGIPQTDLEGITAIPQRISEKYPAI